MKNRIKKIIPNKLYDIIRNLFRIITKRTSYSFYRLSTSLSDNQIYPDFCIKASMFIKVFSNFRRNQDYNKILEHVSNEQGKSYLDEIVKNNSKLLLYMPTFKKNDEWGNPRLSEYAKIGKISPSTLRYIKVLGDLIDLFGKLDGYKICEIGVGYGGQCRIINSIMSPAQYTLVDIKPALMLTQRYLDNYFLDSVLKYKTMNELENDNYDLLISNYAFTELPRSFQDVYLKKVIRNSKMGYITYNENTMEHYNSYKKDELLKIIPNSHIIDEKPLTAENNCIIIWNNN